MLHRVLQTIHRHDMLARGPRIAVAVSGGADSVCLLHLLHELVPQFGLQLSVLHLNHNLRGDESRADADFVRALSASLQLPFNLREAHLPTSGNLEEAARHARFSFFHEILGTGAADSIALAHTRSDQAETVLFRFLRGSGTAGLAAIRPVAEPGIIRPLLDYDRSDVEGYLSSRGISWRTDSTNADRRFDRNRIRHELLPALAREWNPSIASTLAQTADFALAEEAYWSVEIARFASDCLYEDSGAIVLRIPPFLDLPLAVRRRIVRHAIERTKGHVRSIDFSHVESVLSLAGGPKGHGRVHLPGLQVTRSLDWLRFAILAPRPVSYQAEIRIPGCLSLPESGIRLSLELIEIKETSADSDCVYNNEVDWSLLSGFLCCRNWRPGDRYQPIAAASVEKVKTLFQRARIPLWERRNWPVLLHGGSIVWSRRFGVAAGFAAAPGTAPVLRIREL